MSRPRLLDLAGGSATVVGVPPMKRPRLLDAFCGAGGCSVGYARAGFDVHGVDIEPHPDYPFDLTVADAMDVLTDTAYLDLFDVVHASPPCPRYSVATSATGTRDDHPDLVPPVREALRAWGGDYVIENVVGAPMVDPVLLCGAAMGLDPALPRHRLFESNVLLMSPGCACDNRPKVSIYGHSGQDRRVPPQSYRNGRPVYRHVPADEARRLLGVEWMTSRDDVSDAIPPAYTEYLGAQLLDHVAVTA